MDGPHDLCVWRGGHDTRADGQPGGFLCVEAADGRCRGWGRQQHWTPAGSVLAQEQVCVCGVGCLCVQEVEVEAKTWAHAKEVNGFDTCGLDTRRFFNQALQLLVD